MTREERKAAVFAAVKAGKNPFAECSGMAPIMSRESVSSALMLLMGDGRIRLDPENGYVIANETLPR